jgi:predicted secreted Zn-dependent protease
MKIYSRKRKNPASLAYCALFVSLFANASEPSISYYDVSGTNANDIRKQLNENRPKDGAGQSHDAVTWSRVQYKYRYSPSLTGCKFTEFTATLETKMVMPRWIEQDSTSKLGKKWQTYYSALYAHELGHHDIFVQAHAAVENAGSSFETSNKCDAIGDEFKAVYSSLLDKYRKMSQEYDLDTNHGMKLGAVFP